MTFNILITISCIILAIGGFVTGITMRIKRTLGVKIGIAIMIIGIIATTTTASIYGIASSHGMETTRIPISDVFDGIKHTPKSDKKLLDDTKGSIIILYRFDCDDCRSIYTDIKNATKDKNNIYWVASTTKLGKEIVEEYEIREVPTGIYIRNNNFNNTVKGTRYKLSTLDENGNTILNESALNRLLYLQENKE